MNIVLISIDGLGVGNMEDAKKKSNTWETLQKKSTIKDFPFLKSIMNKAEKLYLDYEGADSFLGHLTMSGMQTNELNLKPLSEYKREIMEVLKIYNLEVNEYNGILVVEDKFIINDNFEADHGLAINVAGCADKIDFKTQLKISKEIRKIVKNPRLISFTANDIQIENYIKYTVNNNGYYGVETPKTGVYNDSFQVEHLPANISFDESIQQQALNLNYDVFLYGKFSNIINMTETKKLKKIPEIDIKLIFKNLHNNLVDKGFHCINIQQTDLAGHEGNIEKYIDYLNELDSYLKNISLMNNITFMITSDHGNDPNEKDGLHTREYVPFYSNGEEYVGLKKLSDVNEYIKRRLLK